MKITPPLPPTIPAFHDLKLNPDGRAWFKAYEVTPKDTSIWYVFEANGVFLGKTAIPGDLRVYGVGRDYVLGVRIDEFDVPYVVRYGITN